MQILITKAPYTKVFHIVWNNLQEPFQHDLITLIEQCVNITLLHQDKCCWKVECYYEIFLS
jgi:hypothetical protein